MGLLLIGLLVGLRPRLLHARIQVGLLGWPCMLGMP